MNLNFKFVLDRANKKIKCKARVFLCNGTQLILLVCGVVV